MQRYRTIFRLLRIILYRFSLCAAKEEFDAFPQTLIKCADDRERETWSELVSEWQRKREFKVVEEKHSERDK